ncbi:VPLPA-CTERM sorting domain-containing protein [Massilia sp. YIM B02763]|uniref:VPLPA-CTERM sorting domain-containing protein n=1 Tax=Massilia sp. YIM B02763 TaxID=3050130 RepID=UPI0025B695D7|nr:VPLPA-CTERM sorting domain-containing protein [Massilia sp. YIM B02763]
MKPFTRLVAAAALALGIGQASAGEIRDTGANAYWGGKGYGADVIGSSTYDIQSATITRVGSVLTIVVNTNFAGHAGADAGIVSTKGIGYGDVFLSDVWNPYGSDAHHQNDKASNGTNWDYALSLDNRYNNKGGTFQLLSLDGTNTRDILTPSSYLNKCTLDWNCTYRDGAAVAANTASSTVKSTGLTGTWSVAKDDSLTFKIDLSGSELLNWDSFAMHWGETCANDIIEGITSVKVPEPASLALVLLGLGSFAAMRRRRG